MRVRSTGVALVLFCFVNVSAALGQVLTAGTSFTENQISYVTGLPQTLVDSSRPANASGTIFEVTFAWQQSGCEAAVDILLMRRVGDELVVVSTRGPFDKLPSGRIVTLGLNPPFDVRQGDLVGLRQRTPCGTPGMRLEPAAGFHDPGSERFPFEVTDRVSLQLAEYRGGHLALGARGTTTDYVSAVIPVAISGPGAFGSHFVTSLQIHNPFPSPVVNGRLVFHPAGRFGSFDDPSIEFSLQPGETRHFQDIVASFGEASIGSIDVVTTVAMHVAKASSSIHPNYTPVPPQPSPPATSVLIEASSDSTAGSFGLEAPLVIAPAPTGQGGGPEFLATGAIGVLATPHDLDLYRMNVGVRTMFRGAVILVRTFDAAGVRVGELEREYPPTWFEQVDSSEFAGVPLPANGSIHISVRRGDAIVYGSRVRNVTNDGSLQMARRVNHSGTALIGITP